MMGQEVVGLGPDPTEWAQLDMWAVLSAPRAGAAL